VDGQGDTERVAEPPEPSPTNKAVPPEVVEARDRMGRGLGLLWIGVFVIAAIAVAIVAWLLS
jgi:hypothetical protein